MAWMAWPDLGDQRGIGSKGPVPEEIYEIPLGQANVLRSGRKGAALATLLLDALKGWLPVFLVMRFGAAWDLGAAVAGLCGLAAFLGHLYPVFFGFQGGKGVATALGVVIALAWPVALGAALVWLATALLLHYSSFAALVAAVAAAVLARSPRRARRGSTSSAARAEPKRRSIA